MYTHACRKCWFAGGDTYSDDAEEKQSHENQNTHVEVPDVDTNCDLAAAAAASARDRVWPRDGYRAVVEDSSDEDDNFSGEFDLESNHLDLPNLQLYSLPEFDHAI